VTKKTLHIGRCEGGLYPLKPPSKSSPNKQAFSVPMASQARSCLFTCCLASPEPS
jgi:hypothetical protein